MNFQEERLRRGDDLRLQMAIEESKREKVKPEEVCVLVCDLTSGKTAKKVDALKFLFYYFFFIQLQKNICDNKVLEQLDWHSGHFN